MRKTHTGGFALSLSGGADSALCAAMVYFGMVQAMAALGEERFLATLAACGIRPAPRAAGVPPLEYLRKAIMPKARSFSAQERKPLETLKRSPLCVMTGKALTMVLTPLIRSMNSSVILW